MWMKTKEVALTINNFKYMYNLSFMLPNNDKSTVGITFEQVNIIVGVDIAFLFLFDKLKAEQNMLCLSILKKRFIRKEDMR